MANLDERNQDNAQGAFYTDESCIICGLCDDMAPTIFRESDEGGYNIVYRQPTTEEEVALANEALEACPVESIGNDGASAD